MSSYSANDYGERQDRPRSSNVSRYPNGVRDSKVSLADLMALKSAIDLNAINELLKPEVWTINLSYSKANELLSTQSAAFENEPGKTSWGNE